jgi:hypothetical protein
MGGIIEKMQAEIDELKRKVAKLEESCYPIEYTDGKREAAMHGIFKKAAKPTRAEIVERAKIDVPELRIRHEVDGYWFDVKFVVNSDKRTVVALLMALETVIGRGIAKCAPDDCFNVHIGKAIALRRVLDEEVPDEYLNASAPEGVEVGDFIKKNSTGDFGKVLEIKGESYIYRNLTEKRYGNLPKSSFVVIDDSARYE